MIPRSGWRITVSEAGAKLFYRLMDGEPHLVEAWGINPLVNLKPGYYDLDLTPDPSTATGSEPLDHSASSR
jgi:hypothetical protein